MHVIRLQRALRAAGYKTLTGTGFYGSQTATAVKTVQRGNGFKATGIGRAQVLALLQSGKLKPGKKRRARRRRSASARPRTRPPSPWPSPSGSSATATATARTGPNRWDCSGLTQGAYKAAGVKLPHSARGQMKYGKAIAKTSLKPGDLVFFYSPVRHVAIYAGNGKVIHASRPGQARRLHQDGLHAVRGGAPHRVSLVPP